MQSQVIAMESSSGSPHHVEVAFLDDGRVSVNCSCTGSQMGMYCKHREAIVSGDDSLVVDEHKPVYFEVFQAIGETQLPHARYELQMRLDQIEQEKKDLTARTTQLKKDFARLLREGI